MSVHGVLRKHALDEETPARLSALPRGNDEPVASRRALMGVMAAGALTPVGSRMTTAATSTPVTTTPASSLSAIPSSMKGAGRTSDVNQGQGAPGGVPPAPQPGPQRQLATPLTLDQTQHLVRRTTWGPRRSDVEKAIALGAPGWLDLQLSTSAPADPIVGSIVSALPTVGKSSAAVRALCEANPTWDHFKAHGDLEIGAITRAIWTERQLYEVVVDFFHSRLHVPVGTDKTRYTLTDYDANVIRRHAFGRYADMVLASVTHPAMLSYLDNDKNTRRGGNQNLAREFLELHTFGVNSGYTQADVDAVALLLTGVGVDAATLTMKFSPELHYVGAVTVLGTSYPNATAEGGLDTVKTLVANITKRRNTALSLAADLARRFVSDAPPTTLVNRLADAYQSGGSAIVPMLRVLFESSEFAASVGAKYRRPLENVVATARALGIVPSGSMADTVRTLNNLRWTLNDLGQTPLGHSAPDGHADFARPWLSTAGTLGRWNIQMVLAGGWWKGLSAPPVDSWLGSATTYGQAVDALFESLLLQAPTSAARAALLTFLGKAAADPLSATARSQNYNLRVHVLGLVLAGPQMQVR